VPETVNSKEKDTWSALSDEACVGHYCTSGDMELLGHLYGRYMPMVYGVGMKYLGNREDARDAVMQVFEVLVRDLNRFEIRNFRAWLYGVARNHCLMKLRRDKSAKHAENAEYEKNFVESDLWIHLIEERENELLLDRLKHCLDQLKDLQRKAIELFFFQKLCYKEIAKELVVSEPDVKSNIQNGKRNLKICLETKTVHSHV